MFASNPGEGDGGLEETREGRSVSVEALQRLQAILNAMSEYAVVGTDLSGLVTLFNIGAERLLGYDANEVVNKVSPEVWHDPAEVAARATELGTTPGFNVFFSNIESGSFETREWTFIRRDGSRIPVSLSVSLVRDAGGEVTGYVGIARDLSQEKRALIEHTRLLHQAEAAEAKFRQLVEAAPDAIVTVDADGKIVVVNQQTEKLFGYERSELIGQPVEILLPARLVDRHRIHREKYTSAPTARSMGIGLELMGRRKGGAEFRVEISLSPLTTERDEQLVISIIHDLSERHRAEQVLREQANLLDLATDAIFVRDANGSTIRYWNHGAELLYGWSREEAIGKVSYELLNTRFPVPLSEIEAVISREGQWEGGLIQEIRSGETVHLASIWTVQRDMDGEVVAILEVNRDVTRQVQAEQQLRQQAEELARSNADLQQFAYVASHDLQEPLRMVASYTQLLARRYRGRLDADADEFIAYAVDGANRMQALIQDLLAYSRVGTRGKEFTRTDFNTLVDRVVGDLHAAIVEANAAVSRDDLPTISADEMQIGQVFQNLIQNAIKFVGDEPPRVHVGAVRRESEWLFSVRDNGIGIDSKYAERIFVIFQRLHGVGKYPGTGIGLAICKKIVERHGGRIWLESTPGQGSTFYFTIPERGPNP